MAKSYEELRFTDDFMFGKVMEDRELCRDVLECLLGEKGGRAPGGAGRETVSLYGGRKAHPSGCVYTGMRDRSMMRRCRT